MANILTHGIYYIIMIYIWGALIYRRNDWLVPVFIILFTYILSSFTNVSLRIVFFKVPLLEKYFSLSNNRTSGILRKKVQTLLLFVRPRFLSVVYSNFQTWRFFLHVVLNNLLSSFLPIILIGRAMTDLILSLNNTSVGLY